MDTSQSIKGICRGCRKEVQSPILCRICSAAYHKSCASLKKILSENGDIESCSECRGRKATKISTQQRTLDEKLDEALKIIHNLGKEQVTKEYLKNMIKEIIAMELASVKKDIDDLKTIIKENQSHNQECLREKPEKTDHTQK